MQVGDGISYDSFTYRFTQKLQDICIAYYSSLEAKSTHPTHCVASLYINIFA